MRNKKKKVELPFVSSYPVFSPNAKPIEPQLPEYDARFQRALEDESISLTDGVFEAALTERLSREESSYQEKVSIQLKIECVQKARKEQLEHEIKDICDYIVYLNGELIDNKKSDSGRK